MLSNNMGIYLMQGTDNTLEKGSCLVAHYPSRGKKRVYYVYCGSTATEYALDHVVDGFRVADYQVSTVLRGPGSYQIGLSRVLKNPKNLE